MRILKEEINLTLTMIHDLNKWKIIIIAGLFAAALGFTITETSSSSIDRINLILIVPFVCAYIDLMHYQHLIRVYVLAQFIRKYEILDGSENSETLERKILVDYEKESEDFRQSKAFDFERYAQLGSSIISCILAFISIWIVYSINMSINIWAGTGVIVFGSVLVYVAFYFFNKKAKGIHNFKKPLLREIYIKYTEDLEVNLSNENFKSFLSNLDKKGTFHFYDSKSKSLSLD